MTQDFLDTGFIQLAQQSMFATVEVTGEPGEFVTEWWVSCRFQSNIQVLGSVSIPIFGTALNEAERRVHFIAPLIFDFLTAAAGGTGAPQGHPSSPLHASMHLREHYQKFEVEGLTERTAIFYDLLSQFHVATPAAWLAHIEGVENVRTIHGRLAEARKRGLLESPGRGKRSS